MRTSFLIPLLIVACGGSKEQPPAVAPAPAPTPVATAAPEPAPPPAAPTPPPAPAPVVATTPDITKNNAFGMAKPGDKGIKGLVYQITPGTKEIPTFGASLTPVAALYSDKWDISPRKFTEGFPGANDKLVEWYAIRWEGKTNAKTAGVHTFKIKSKDGARLSIDGQMVVNNDGLHDKPTDSSGEKLLNAGEHTFVIEYFQGAKADIALQIWVTAPKQPAKILTTAF